MYSILFVFFLKSPAPEVEEAALATVEARKLNSVASNDSESFNGSDTGSVRQDGEVVEDLNSIVSEHSNSISIGGKCVTAVLKSNHI